MPALQSVLISSCFFFINYKNVCEGDESEQEQAICYFISVLFSI